MPFDYDSIQKMRDEILQELERVYPSLSLTDRLTITEQRLQTAIMAKDTKTTLKDSVDNIKQYAKRNIH